MRKLRRICFWKKSNNRFRIFTIKFHEFYKLSPKRVEMFPNYFKWFNGEKQGKEENVENLYTFFGHEKARANIAPVKLTYVSQMINDLNIIENWYSMKNLKL